MFTRVAKNLIIFQIKKTRKIYLQSASHPKVRKRESSKYSYSRLTHICVVTLIFHFFGRHHQQQPHSSQRNRNVWWRRVFHKHAHADENEKKSEQCRGHCSFSLNTCTCMTAANFGGEIFLWTIYTETIILS